MLEVRLATGKSWLFLILSIVLWPLSVRAQPAEWLLLPQVRLEYDRGPGHHRCPEASYFTDTVEARVSYPPFSKDAVVRLVVTVRRAGNLYRARWEMLDETGLVRRGEFPPEGHPPMADCFSVVQGVGLAFAIELEPVRRSVSPAPRDLAATPSRARTGSHARAKPESTPAPLQTGPPAEDARGRAPRRIGMDVTFAVSAHALATVGLTAEVSMGFGLGADVRGELLSIGLEVRGVPPATIQAQNPIDPSKSYSAISVQMSQWTALLVPCARWRYLVGCGVLQGGFIYLREDEQDLVLAQLGFGPRLGFDVPFADIFGVFGFGEALFAPFGVGVDVGRRDVSGDDGANVEWTQSIVSGFFGVGLSVKLL